MGIEVAFKPVARRRPAGPSLAHKTGIPKSKRALVTPPKAAPVPGVTLGLLIPSPNTRVQRSVSLIWAIKSFSLAFSRATSTNLMPRSPV